jgi:hypothetical protein
MIIAVAIRTEQDTYELPRPARHHHLIYELAYRGHAIPITGEQGFIDDQRGFVTREEAAQIALSQGQVTKLHAPPSLFSEDLW